MLRTKNGGRRPSTPHLPATGDHIIRPVFDGHIKRRNCSFWAISPFPTVFSKDLYGRNVKTRACFGKALTHIYRYIIVCTCFQLDHIKIPLSCSELMVTDGSESGIEESERLLSVWETNGHRIMFASYLSKNNIGPWNKLWGIWLVVLTNEEISFFLPPASNTMYFLPGWKLLRKAAPWLSTCFSTGSKRQYKEAASGSRAIVKSSLAIPAWSLKMKKKKEENH